MTMLYGIAAVALLWWFMNILAKANPATMAKTLRLTAAILALGAAALFGLRGRLDLALLLGSVGASLLGWNSLKIPGWGNRAQRTTGTASRVRSVMIEMELDHDSGEMDGSVLAGPLSGQRLNALDEASLRTLLIQCSADPDGVRLLEAYLDRRFPHWRGGGQENTQESGQESGRARSGARTASGAMTSEEAHQILGLEPGASAEEIHHAHRALMKKLHPDQGGTTYLAARVNQAKDLLLRPNR